MKTAISSIIFIAYLMAPLASNGQLIVEAKLIDATTSEPVRYANVVLKGTYRGTATNDEGQFVLAIENTHKEDSLYFSCIGYKPMTKAVQSFVQHETISLEPDPMVLKEVWVSALMPKEIMRKSIARISENYDEQMHEPKGFYREKIRMNDQYVGFAESTASYIDWGWGENAVKEPYNLVYYNPFSFEQSRRSEYTFPYCKVGWPRRTLHFELLFFEKKFIRNSLLSEKELDYRKYHLEGVTSFEGRKTYIIRFEPNMASIQSMPKKHKKKGYGHLLAKGLVYIDVEGYAIVKVSIENNENWYLYYKDFYLLKKSIKIQPEFTETKAEAIYSNFRGKYYMSYVSLSCQYKDSQTIKDKISNVHEFSEFFVIDRTPNIDAEYVNKGYGSLYPSDRHFLLQKYRYHLNKYDPEFWSSYKIPPNPEYEIIRKDLEHTNSLEEQYVSTSGKEISAE